MRLHNTLTRQTEDFQPISDAQVKLYTCGPTVYDYAQIGNLRAFVFDDTLRRTLSAAGYNVRHVMNITDVGHLVSDDDEGEDKLEKGAGRENKTVQEVSQFYTHAFLDDVQALNVLEPNAYNGPHGRYALATDFIAEQIDLVQRLLDKDFAYQTEQAIYFDVSKLDDYGKLSRQKLSEKEVAARAEVVSDKAKRNPQDFALWFFSVGRFQHHSLKWPSPWGEGFPGWHLECSAIIHSTLHEPIDIHTGGVDHIGTHHTNEIAQTEAAFGVKLANYWVHNEHLLVNGHKMSKSMQNFYTLKDIKDKGFEPLALRLMFLQSHYRTQANFSWEVLEAAAAQLDSLRAWAERRYQGESTLSVKDNSGVKAAVFDDLNTPKALAELSKLDGVPDEALLVELDKLFGLDLSKLADIDEPVKRLIMQRQAARENNDWDAADKLRLALDEQGIEINDTPQGPVWHRLRR